MRTVVLDPGSWPYCGELSAPAEAEKREAEVKSLSDHLMAGGENWAGI